ncbi:hypothetical protein MIND_00999500 [Mycena indigotica]|uniref:DUF6534 domain-containing protein n=1 Tax=Mycena indigotica TaxID=2126181 RepID=A0A8H6VUQ1_9AGAR|nr:uncharacterized protein MIND_00999500 [Mycena indigotica]KAF7294629.1 hypothetical protein MIND_00999500 [Mycena indigotica]
MCFACVTQVHGKLSTSSPWWLFSTAFVSRLKGRPHLPRVSVSLPEAMAVTVALLTLPMFIGIVVNWLLLGILLVQIYIYYAAFPQDPNWAKRGVAIVLFAELLETFSNFHDMIEIFGLGWGDMEALDRVGWAWFSTPVLGPFISSIGQGFFAYRIYLIGQSVYLPILVYLTSMLQLGAGVWGAVNMCKAGRFSALQEHDILVPTALWLSSTLICDLLIMFGMVYNLLKSRQREFNRINSTISKVLLLTVETGMICTIVVVVDLYLFLAYKKTNLHLATCFELSKFYSNSILLIFNSRARVTYPGTQHSHSSSHGSSTSRPVVENTTIIRFAGPRDNTSAATTTSESLSVLELEREKQSSYDLHVPKVEQHEDLVVSHAFAV